MAVQMCPHRLDEQRRADVRGIRTAWVRGSIPRGELRDPRRLAFRVPMLSGVAAPGVVSAVDRFEFVVPPMPSAHLFSSIWLGLPACTTRTPQCRRQCSRMAGSWCVDQAVRHGGTNRPCGLSGCISSHGGFRRSSTCRRPSWGTDGCQSTRFSYESVHDASRPWRAVGHLDRGWADAS
jgi:hypothetical protein